MLADLVIASRFVDFHRLGLDLAGRPELAS